jgi:hypothetical protein
LFKYIIRLDDYKVKNDDSFMVADDNDKSRSVNIFCNNRERYQETCFILDFKLFT